MKTRFWVIYNRIKLAEARVERNDIIRRIKSYLSDSNVKKYFSITLKELKNRNKILIDYSSFRHKEIVYSAKYTCCETTCMSTNNIESAENGEVRTCPYCGASVNVYDLHTQMGLSITFYDNVKVWDDMDRDGNIKLAIQANVYKCVGYRTINNKGIRGYLSIPPSELKVIRAGEAKLVFIYKPVNGMLYIKRTKSKSVIKNIKLPWGRWEKIATGTYMSNKMLYNIIGLANQCTRSRFTLEQLTEKLLHFKSLCFNYRSRHLNNPILTSDKVQSLYNNQNFFTILKYPVLKHICDIKRSDEVYPTHITPSFDIPDFVRNFNSKERSILETSTDVKDFFRIQVPNMNKPLFKELISGDQRKLVLAIIINRMFKNADKTYNAIKGHDQIYAYARTLRRREYNKSIKFASKFNLMDKIYNCIIASKDDKEIGRLIEDTMSLILQIGEGTIEFSDGTTRNINKLSECPRFERSVFDQAKTINEFHNYMSYLSRNIKEPIVKFAYKEKEDSWLLKADGSEYGGITFKVPQDNHTLMSVGQAMSICVGSYGDRVKRRATNILVGYENNKPLVCIEIGDDKTLLQVKGQCNTHVINSIKEATIQMFKTLPLQEGWENCYDLKPIMPPSSGLNQDDIDAINHIY